MPEEYVIVSDPDICGGKPVVAGTRVPAHYILELSARGYDVDEIHNEYPTVPRELIVKAIKLLKESRVIRVAH
ncbi:MAG: DUF433 domain-containing protein [Candidatus Bathyarchaeia archaeon]